MKIYGSAALQRRQASSSIALRKKDTATKASTRAKKELASGGARTRALITSQTRNADHDVVHVVEDRVEAFPTLEL